MTSDKTRGRRDEQYVLLLFVSTPTCFVGGHVLLMFVSTPTCFVGGHVLLMFVSTPTCFVGGHVLLLLRTLIKHDLRQNKWE
jgi:hypothetical protein